MTSAALLSCGNVEGISHVTGDSPQSHDWWGMVRSETSSPFHQPCRGIQLIIDQIQPRILPSQHREQIVFQQRHAATYSETGISFVCVSANQKFSMNSVLASSKSELFSFVQINLHES